MCPSKLQPSMANCCYPWPAMAGRGYYWLAVAIYNLLLAGRGWLWLAEGGYNLLQVAGVSCCY